ncbi:MULTISPECIES: hypothetical protein [Flavobacterium]|uniref:PEP-CTERM protein-sorting domain-containing protein n=1 Tax=Flavobacterium keumense TaxID=1306518 RepID=A0ABY8N8M0_9FLAO|nr:MULTISPECIES: hypothetical protein [Flavobacterium]WGK95523.1 hypothetical protein MG292_04650 [Flavobacterium keumense]
MTYLKYTPYLYLILGVYLVIDSIVKWNDPAGNSGLTLIFAGLAFFLFAFRRRYAKRFESRRNNKN